MPSMARKWDKYGTLSINIDRVRLNHQTLSTLAKIYTITAREPSIYTYNIEKKPNTKKDQLWLEAKKKKKKKKEAQDEGQDGPKKC